MSKEGGRGTELGRRDERMGKHGTLVDRFPRTVMQVGRTGEQKKEGAELW
jgi:hypothetical protein